MKLNRHSKSSLSKGFTLIEITLVIALILGLIAVLVVSIQAYKAGSDRARCIMNIQAGQKAVRSYANMNELNPGAAVTGLYADLVGAGKYLEAAMVCPAGGTYPITIAAIPAIGTLAFPCTLSVSDKHVPKSTTGW